MRWIACLLSLIVVLPAGGQQRVDYGAAAHWTGGVGLEPGLGYPILMDDVVICTDGSGTLRRVDVSDLYSPTVLPALSLPEPARRVFGPFADHLYVAGAEHLYVLDASSLEQVGVLDHQEVTGIDFGVSFGALLAEGGDDLVIFDVSQPASLPVFHAGPLTGGHESMDHVEIRGTRILVSKYMSFTAVGIFDAGDPANPQHLADFGWAYQWWKRSVISQHVSIRALDHGEPYTIEHYEYYDSSVGIDHERSHVTRWSFDDPLHPEVIARWSPTQDHLGRIRPYHAMDGDDLLTLYLDRIVAVDLTAPDMDLGSIRGGFRWQYNSTGIAADGDVIVVCQSDGSLHVFRDREPDGPEYEGLADHGIICAALGEQRYMMLQKRLDDLFEWRYQLSVWDTTDPREPVTVFDRSFGNPRLLDCAVAQHCFVTFSSGSSGSGLLHSYDLEFPYRAVIQGQAHDFEFIDDVYGVAAGDEGLRVYDTSTPTAFVSVAHPCDEPLIAVSVLTGDGIMAPAAAALDSAGTLAIWDLEDCRDPRLQATLAADLDGLVDLNGGPRRLAAGVRLGWDGWPGYTLVLIDCTDPSAPEIAGTTRLPAHAFAGSLRDDVLYLACNSAGMIVVDLQDLHAPRVSGGLATDHVHDARLQGEDLLLAGADLHVVPPDVATPVLQVVSELEVAARDRWIEISWSLAPGAEPTSFRLMANAGGPGRQIDIAQDGGRWIGRDQEYDWGETRYVVEHRRSEEVDWSPVAEQSIAMVEPPHARILDPAPNPFNPRVSLVVDTVRSEHITVRVYDLAGRVLRTLVDEPLPPGRHPLIWDGSDHDGRPMPSGTYLAELTAGSTQDTRKLQLLR